MTGAPMPAGADAVVPVERTMAAPQYDDVHVSMAVSAGANVLHRGESMQTGDRIFPTGHKLRPQDLGVLAEMGVAILNARRRPRVAILATGDELVPPASTPGPGQIRNSNETLLAALVIAAGCEAVPLGIARDDRDPPAVEDRRGSRVRRVAAVGWCFGRCSRSGSVGAQRRRRRTGVPQGEREAGQAGLVWRSEVRGPASGAASAPREVRRTEVETEDRAQIPRITRSASCSVYRAIR